MKRFIVNAVLVFAVLFSGCQATKSYNIKLPPNYSIKKAGVKEMQLVFLSDGFFQKKSEFPLCHYSDRPILFKGEGSYLTAMMFKKNVLFQKSANETLQALKPHLKKHNMFNIVFDGIASGLKNHGIEIGSKQSTKDLSLKLLQSYNTLSKEVQDSGMLDLSLYRDVKKRYVVEMTKPVLYLKEARMDPTPSKQDQNFSHFRYICYFGVVVRLIDLQEDKVLFKHRVASRFPEVPHGLDIEKIVTNQEYLKDVLVYVLKEFAEELYFTLAPYKGGMPNRNPAYKRDSTYSSLYLSDDAYNSGLRLRELNNYNMVNYNTADTLAKYKSASRAFFYMPEGENIAKIQLLPTKGTATPLELMFSKWIIFNIDSSENYLMELESVDDNDFKVRIVSSAGKEVVIQEYGKGEIIFPDYRNPKLFDDSVKPKKKKRKYLTSLKTRNYNKQLTGNDSRLDLSFIVKDVSKPPYPNVRNVSINNKALRMSDEPIYLTPGINFIGFGFAGYYRQYVSFKAEPNKKYTVRVEGNTNYVNVETLKAKDQWSLAIYDEEGKRVELLTSYYAYAIGNSFPSLTTAMRTKENPYPDPAVMYENYNDISDEDKEKYDFPGKKVDWKTLS